MALKEKIEKKAEEIKDTIVENRRFLHKNPELSMDLPITYDYVKGKLEGMGYTVENCGKSGILATAGGKKEGKVFLIRGDMDALPIVEETDLEFKSTNDNMHACGHDMHTSMLLGAAEILKEFEDEIEGTIKLMFQPGEETLLGAKSMVDAGILENPSVDAAIMIHVMAGIPLPSGMVVVTPPGAFTAASDWFEIKVQGQGGHGAMPNTTVDPINVASHIHQSLQALNSRELPPEETAVVTVGRFVGGTTSNVIPDTAELNGTIRTFSAETRAFVAERIKDISEYTAKAFRATAEAKIIEGCPSVVNDKQLVEDTKNILKELLDENQILDAEKVMPGGQMAGSEDFGYVSEKVPGLFLGISAGNSEEGYEYPQHHPKVMFDESVLPLGASVYAYTAMKWLEQNK